MNFVDSTLARNGALTLNIRRCERDDPAELDKAAAIQCAIDAGLVEIGDYAAGILTYKLTRRGMNLDYQGTN